LINLIKNILILKVSLFSFLLYFFPSVCYAGWVHVASTLDDDAVFYVSHESIKKTGAHTRTAWEVVNHPHKTRQGYLSAKVQQEYDCKSNRVRMLSASSHSELFGKGLTITTAQERLLPWQEMPKGSVATFARDYICSQKL
jgi:hypothetical protein